VILPGMAGVSAQLDLTFDNVAVDYDSIVDITFEVDENMHDYACVVIRGIPVRAVNDYIGTNVLLIVSSGAQFRHDFEGTVESVEPVSRAREGVVNGSPFQTAKIHCYGNSYRMRGKRSRVWENVSLQGMASTLAGNYGFSSCSIAPKRSIPRFVQENESDWEAIVRYASLYGFKVNLHGTHLHVYDPMAALSRSRSLHKLTTTERGKANVPGKVTSFQADVGRHAVDGIHKDATVHVMTDSGRRFTVSSSGVQGLPPGEFPHHMNHTVDTYAEAKAIIDSEARREYDYVGSVSCIGVAGAFPGGVVDLDRYRSGLDGFWYVSSVKHSIHSGSFSSALTIKRFAEKPLSLTSTQAYVKPPVSIIKNGRWEASKYLRTHYA
jgi:phage protein D